MKITNVKRPTLQQWLRDGFVTATVPGEGPGTRNLFDFSDICAIVFFHKLINNGVSRDVARLMTATIKPAFENDNDPVKYVLITITPNALLKLSPKDDPFYRLKYAKPTGIEVLVDKIREMGKVGFDSCHIYDISGIIKLVKRRIKAL